MIYIGKPYIEEREGRVHLTSHITNELECKNIDIFYSVEPEYAKFLCYEQADAFVIPMLLRAIVTGQDIEVDAPLSEKLLHNLQYGVVYALTNLSMKNIKYPNDVPTLAETFKKYINYRKREPIQVISKGKSSYDYKGNAVGTGCSLGVDSISVIKKYLLDDNCMSNYRLTHFACFNVGAFGTHNTENTRSSFYREVNRIKQFAQKLNLPVVAVDTNLHEFYPELSFNWNYVFMNMGAVLALQKLWNKYIFASANPCDKFEFDIFFNGKYTPFLLPHLCTESTELIEGDMEKSRSAKVNYIMNDDIVKKNLNVCLKEQSKNNNTRHSDVNSRYINCGYCEKCLRTILQLEIYGKLEDFEDIIDLSHWKHLKPYYLGKVIACRKDNLMYDDILNTITSEYHIPLFSKIYAKIYKPYQIIKKVLKRK